MQSKGQLCWRRVGVWLALTGWAFTGCTLCPSPYDDDYGTFGSRTPRTDMRNGRVGSIFSDPNWMDSTSTEIVDPAVESIGPMEIPSEMEMVPEED